MPTRTHHYRKKQWSSHCSHIEEYEQETWQYLCDKKYLLCSYWHECIRIMICNTHVSCNLSSLVSYSLQSHFHVLLTNCSLWLRFFTCKYKLFSHAKCSLWFYSVVNYNVWLQRFANCCESSRRPSSQMNSLHNSILTHPLDREVTWWS